MKNTRPRSTAGAGAFAGLLLQALRRHQRAERPDAGAPQAAVVDGGGAAAGQTGQGEDDGKRERAHAESAQGEGGLHQGVPRVSPQPPGSAGSNMPSSLTLALFCQELMRAQEEAMLPKDGEAEAKVLQEELQLLLRKEKEAQVFAMVWGLFGFVVLPPNTHLRLQKELSALRLSLGHQQLTDPPESSALQVGDGSFCFSVGPGLGVCSPCELCFPRL